jgi:DNA-binding helix-hairpin-helix protein with protein kinase domain
MTMWVHVEGRRRTLKLGSSLARGGEGTVYSIEGDGASVAKIYHRERTEQLEQLPARAKKLAAMLDNPPRTLTIRMSQAVLPLLAWPTHIIDGDDKNFSGFQMPLVVRDKTVSVSLSKYLGEMNQRRELVENELCLPSRLTLCRSLAGIIADLHSQNHFVIDFKPDNLRVFRGTCIPCFLDTDSFSIEAKGGERFPASAITPEYTCPELLAGEGGMNTQGANQDLFALAVMLFQILNNNIHPFIGKRHDLAAGDDDLLKDRIRLGLYAYGLKANPRIDPVVGSDHDFLPQATRKLFDRALSGTQPQNRPTAKQWKDHFNHFLRSDGQFLKCGKEPQSVMHIHFAGAECPECRRVLKFPVKPARTPASDSMRKSQPASAAAPRTTSRKRKLMGAILTAGALMLLWYLMTH